MSQSANREYFHSLTSLRGIAALWVALGHISWTLPSATLVSLLPIVRQGYLAVDFFFILSGFVLAHAYKIDSLENWREYINFCQVRIARILPVHIVILVVFGLIFLLFQKVGLVLPGVYGVKAFWGELFLIHILPVFPENYFFAWNYPAWTLFLEVWWFLIVVVFLNLLRPILKKIFDKQSRGVNLAIAFFMLAILSGMVILQKSPALINDPNFYNSIFRSATEFLAGIFLYRAFSLKHFKFGGYFSLIIYGAILLGVLLWLTPLPQFITVSYWLFLIPLILMLALDSESILHRVLVSKFFIYLGNISYSLYLVHGPLERVIATLYKKTPQTSRI